MRYHRPALSPRLLKLPSSYRKTAWAEVDMPMIEGRGQFLEVARFVSSTAGHVDVFSSQDGSGHVREISESEFYRLIAQSAHKSP